MHRLLSSAGLAMILFVACGAQAETNGGSVDDAHELAQSVEELKLQSINLARDLWLLEQGQDEGQNRLVIFVSVDPRLRDRLAHIELRLGDKTVARHDYSPAESEALSKGGTHRLYTASLESGRHVLEAQIEAGAGTDKLRQSTKLSFRGGDAPKTIELRLEATEPGLAELRIREWD